MPNELRWAIANLGFLITMTLLIATETVGILYISVIFMILALYEDTIGLWHMTKQRKLSTFERNLVRAAGSNVSVKNLPPIPQRTRAGYVYLVQSPTGAYKIGRTTDPDDRMRTFKVKLPFEVEYIHVIQCLDMYKLEKQLHRKFKAQRINGEWFNLSADDIRYIQNIGDEKSADDDLDDFLDSMGID